MSSFSDANPFARRESHSVQAVTTYKVLTILTWIVNALASIYYTYGKPEGDTIWSINSDYKNSPFHLNALIVSIYWTIVFLWQIGYVWHLFSNKDSDVQAAAGVGSHFIFNNLLQIAFVLLFVESHFFWAEIILIINFFNLSFLYFRHNTAPRLIHIPAVAGPLAWTFVALYWDGAIAVNSHSWAARVVANVAVWGFLVYGLFYLFAYKDYTIGFALSVLTAALGVGQFFTKFVALQWIFAFTIMGVLFLVSLLVSVPLLWGKEFTFRREVASDPENQETAPLLNDQ